MSDDDRRSFGLLWSRELRAPDAADNLARQLEALEAERDALALRLAVLEEAGAERVPAKIVRRLVAGESPVRVWREYRRLTLHALADQAGISPSMLSEIENGKKDGSVRTLVKLARVLRIDVDDLLPWDDEPPAAGVEPVVGAELRRQLRESFELRPSSSEAEQLSQWAEEAIRQVAGTVPPETRGDARRRILEAVIKAFDEPERRHDA